MNGQLAQNEHKKVFFEWKYRQNAGIVHVHAQDGIVVKKEQLEHAKNT